MLLQVVGSLAPGQEWDDADDSIDDDTATDGGELSRAGSDGEDGLMHGGGGGGADAFSDDGGADGGDGQPTVGSEDSRF